MEFNDAISFAGIVVIGVAFDGMDHAAADTHYDAGMAQSVMTVQDENVTGFDECGVVHGLPSGDLHAMGFVPVVQTGAGPGEWIDAIELR